ncbi:uncharacterized protein LOC114365747 [Ostrinia furnacalis]|uniref:uncharacterized protein LOC114365747 n=1 Tax=Ostrinia furnacalis TaxID=93504 RepID=UPI001039A2D2|nr:uncharacterized protein LOC114365747 [Ostrinia furnacalis]
MSLKEGPNENNQDDQLVTSHALKTGISGKKNKSSDMATDNLASAADNLGNRQRDLNNKVNEAVALQVKFDMVIDMPENNNVDKLFKIDLAAKCKNLDYIIDILKSGDDLYTTRALKKCKWLFADEYSDVINSQYLYENIFTVTSMNMKNKILKAISINVKNPERAAQFYNACMEEKMFCTAFNCLINTSETFKLKTLPNLEKKEKFIFEKMLKYFKLLIGKSFDVLNAVMNLDYYFVKSIRRKLLFDVKKLYYSVSQEKYLDIAEKYCRIRNEFYFCKQNQLFDAKLSKSIMQNNKDRVLANPVFYFYRLDRKTFIKYSTIDDTKEYKSHDYGIRENDIQNSILNIVQNNDNIIKFLKTFFTEHYPNVKLKINRRVYEMKTYHFTPGYEYRYFKFIQFELAFPEIKKLVDVTNDTDTRNDMVTILIESAKNNRDLKYLFEYYNNFYLNELRTYKDSFLKAVISHHNVFMFDDLCWAAFYKILLSMNIYNENDTNVKNNIDYANESYKTLILLYHILHDKLIPENTMKYFLENFNVYTLDNYTRNIGHENFKKIQHYFFDHSKNEVLKRDVKRHFNNLNKYYTKIPTRSGDHPKVSTIVVQKRLLDRQLLQDLKKDKMLVLSKVVEVKNEYEKGPPKLDIFLKKIKIYFSDDIAKVYLAMFEDLIDENKNLRTLHAGIRGILKIGNERVVQELMSKHAPVVVKEWRKNKNKDELSIQKAIRLYASISRPFVPPAIVFKYMKDSSAKYCLHSLKTYFAILPSPMCLEFVQLLLDAPILIQKYTIQLAFDCCTAQSLTKVITDIWGSTNNMYTRSIIYETMLNKIVDNENQTLFEMLLKCTKSLKETDENELFDILVSKKLPDYFLKDYIEAVWEAVSSFEDKKPNVERKEKVIRHIQEILHVVRKSFVKSVIDEHMNMMITKNNLKITYAQNELSQLCKDKWQLVARFIMFNTRSESSPDEYCVLMSRDVVTNSIDKWDKVIYDDFVYQRLLNDFFRYLENASFNHNLQHYEDAVPIFEDFLSLVESSLPSYATYKLIWDLKLAIISRQVIKNNKSTFEQTNKPSDYHSGIINTFIEFSRELGKAISMYMNKQSYFISFSENLKEMIENNVQHVIRVLNHYLKISYNLHFYGQNSIKIEHYIDDIKISLATGLTELEFPETFLMAVLLLPPESPKDSFMFVINKLHKCPYPEVLFALHSRFQKFCNILRGDNKADNTDEQCYLLGPDFFN